MWTDAIRVCKDYLPSLLPSLQAEYTSTNESKGGDVDLRVLLTQANEWAMAGQHKQAIDCLLQVNNDNADASVVKRALIRAADMLNKFLSGDDATEITKILAPRYGVGVIVKSCGNYSSFTDYLKWVSTTLQHSY